MGERRRKPWLAALLTLWMPGLGQIYAGDLTRGAVICCLWWGAVVAIFASTTVLPAAAGAWVPYGIFLFGAAIMVDAARTARRAPRPFVLVSYNRWYIYLTMPFFFGAPIWIPLRALIKGSLYEAFSLPTDSMAPTIRKGDWIYTTQWRGAVNRGAIVVFRHGGNTFVKRAVGIAGDTLDMHHDSLYVNGRYVREPYAIPGGEDAATQSTWGPVIVPPHMCFVLGDNRGNSLDSREYGSVPLDSVIKRPIGIYFSIDPETHAVRWSRIGRDVSR